MMGTNAFGKFVDRTSLLHWVSVCSFDLLLTFHLPFQFCCYCRMIINLYLQDYSACIDRRSRTKLNIQILQQIHACGGKFVKQQPKSDAWMEISDSEARHKIGHALRDTMVWRDTNNNKAASTDSSTSATTKWTLYMARIIKNRSNLSDPKEFKQVVNNAVEILQETELSDGAQPTSKSTSNNNKKKKNISKKLLSSTPSTPPKKTMDMMMMNWDDLDLDQDPATDDETVNMSNMTPLPPPIPSVSWSLGDIQRKPMERLSTVDQVMAEWCGDVDIPQEPTSTAVTSHIECDPSDWERICNVLAV